MLTTDEQLRMFRLMCKVRAFEDTGERLVRGGEIVGNLHLSTGQEAVAVGVCSALRVDDHIATTHRGHGHCVAKGGDVERMFAELYGHVDGYCKGRAGSMHIADPRQGILGATAIVGGSFGIAVGAAFSAQVLAEDRVAVAFFGEGAAAEGSLHEALNIAALWKLPVIFCCENNGYAELTPVSDHLSGTICGYAQSHSVPGLKLDGNDVLAVRTAAEEAINIARAGGGPTLLECETYRWSGHYVGDPERYRTPDELVEWKAKDPIIRLAAQLGSAVGPQRLQAIRDEVLAEVTAAADRAANGEPATAGLLLEDVYAA
jgi:TPP-dependent pyruvate/acetoin dehydrogenase alpha subunit